MDSDDCDDRPHLVLHVSDRHGCADLACGADACLVPGCTDALSRALFAELDRNSRADPVGDLAEVAVRSEFPIDVFSGRRARRHGSTATRADDAAVQPSIAWDRSA